MNEDYRLFESECRAGVKDAWEQAQKLHEDISGSYGGSKGKRSIMADITRHILKGKKDGN